MRHKQAMSGYGTAYACIHNKPIIIIPRGNMDRSLAKYLAADRTEEEFLEQLAFNEKMAELGRLAVGMVHELNTPLSVIVSAAQMVLREEGLSESVKEMVARIDVEAQRLSQFTKGLLSFSRKEDGAVAEADVNQVLRDVMSFLKYDAQKRSVAVVEEMTYDLPAVAADSNRLKQIFINLVMNALQVMENGGSLLLKTTMADDREVEVEIADTGCGIPQEKLARIFDPFYTTKAAGEGTGLGLYITKSLVELLGGRISVRSEMGEGTAFMVRLPLA
jgi:signal transduction histidine kinase